VIKDEFLRPKMIDYRGLLDKVMRVCRAPLYDIMSGVCMLVVPHV